ncbi:type II secretion system protein E [candidate division TA06 bacterium DG_24]|uniref:Type II secretion system protein GspE n=3 Tax=Bacteria division TA06 TaxID=1156500 RepID=A0A0S8GDK8_UNCT6|nr:MAG: type II secretion system protein E [candidate division TA06 bacterium DG_24]KPK69901.1 MAG: type II secretion system protein GspE [candidate division TA06 bacterium SM23_40]
MPRLGDMLIEAGLITEEQLKEALEAQKRDGGRLGFNLVKLGFVSDVEITKFLAKQYNVPGVDLAYKEIPEAVLKLLPPDVAQKYQAVPVSRVGKVITVAMANPSDVFAIEDIKFVTGFEVRPAVASEGLIQGAIGKYYQAADVLSQVMKAVKEDELTLVDKEKKDDEVSDIALAVETGPVVKLVNSILIDGISRGSSDLHIEPYEKELRIRYCIDGHLHEVMSPPARLRAAVTSRIKIMAKMNIAEKRLPQDGRLKVKVRGKVVDLRVSTVPSLFGEKICLRVLDRSAISFDLATLGFEEDEYQRIMRAIQVPYGIILVTGPTGSGKTTTLYAALNKINTPDVNITTAEDPIEYSLIGVNQVQIREDIGFTFADALRSFLRQDPNIIMVGEIRDQETAEIAIRAALTGHLVLSTIHTNSTAGTITRLINMGVEPFLIASSLNLIQAQRLLRKICANCKEPIDIKPEVLQDMGVDPAALDGAQIYAGRGCAHCSGTGYRGRIGIFEVMGITPRIREMILNRDSTEKIEQVGKGEGLRTLHDNAILKLKAGVTSVDEVVRETKVI